MYDLGHRLTDKELTKLEKRISSVYGEAAKELQSTIDAYFKLFEKRDAEMKKLIGTVVNGKEWTEKDYKQWRLAQIGRGKRFEALRDKLAERMTKANETAVAYVNDATPGIYSLNRNYAAYTIEQVAGDVGFTLWDEQTVKRLIVEQPDLMPYYPAKRAVSRGIDLAYGKKQITASVTSSILQGKSIKGMADDLQTRIPTMNRNSAIRTARTGVTNAQNAGRQDSYVAAEKMGIEMEREWVCALNARTRPEHAEADGQVVGVDEPFTVGGEKLMYPGDRSGSGWNIYNCRCTQIAKVKGVDTSDSKRRARDPETGESVLIENMSYAEWAGWKKKEKNSVAKNAFGEKITFDEVILNDDKWNKTVSTIRQLSAEYNTKLKEVRVGSKKAGSVQISGSVMNLASQQTHIAIHEFAHTISIEHQTKFGLYDEKDFWKEVKKIQRAYKKETEGDPLKWISSYEHSARGTDEFMAEAFTLAIMDKYGMDIPSFFGGGLSYAKQVLAVINKYFRKLK